MPLVRRTPPLPVAAVQKIPKRCVLLGVSTGGEASGGSAGGSSSTHGRGRGLRVRAIRIAPEL